MRKFIYSYVFVLVLYMWNSEARAATYTVVESDKKSFTFTAKKAIKKSTVTAKTVKMVDQYGQTIPVQSTVSGKKLVVKPKQKYINYWKYTLTITPKVKLTNGKSMYAKNKVKRFQLVMPINEKSTKISAVKKSAYKGQAMVTFSYDDGYTNWMQYSLPLHQYYNFPGTYNIITKYLYDMPNATYMNPNAVWVSAQLGMEIASHTANHHALPTLSDEDIHYEFKKSKADLAAIDIDVKTLAAPFSSYDNNVKEIAKAYFDGVRVLNHRTNGANYDAYWLNSIAVTNQTTLNELKSWIDTAIQEKTWLIIMWHDIHPNVSKELLDDDVKEHYDATPLLLQQTIAYIKAQASTRILPVSTIEGLTLMKK